ncbi:hypothetical protein Tco_0319581 [Tanacetum coccineum]
MFTDEHALDYSSSPLWDDYDDELFDLETVNDNTYNDPFDSKEEKIKDSKILINELDPPGSSDFLSFPECDSVFYKDFSEVDALPLTNNEDKSNIDKISFMDFYLHTNDQISLGYFQDFHCDAIMGQMLYQFQRNQRDYFSNDTFRGHSHVSSAVYYEVAPHVVFRCVVYFWRCYTYHANDMFNPFVQKLPAYKQLVSVNDTYVDFLSDSNVISDNPYPDKNENKVVQEINFLAQNDVAILSLIENMQHEVTRCNMANLEFKQVNDQLTIELDRCKKQIKVLESKKENQLVFTLKEKDLESQMRKLIVEYNHKEKAFNKEILTLKRELSFIVENNSSLKNNLTILKQESTKQEDKYIDEMKDDEQAKSDDLPVWISLMYKFYKPVAPIKHCRVDVVRTRDQEDHNDDDNHPEGESSAKRQKTSEHGTYTREVSPELLDEVSRKVMTTNDLQRMQNALTVMMRNRCDSGEEHQYHLDQMQSYIERQINENSKARKYVPSLHKIHAFPFPGNDLVKLNTRWVKKTIKRVLSNQGYGQEYMEEIMLKRADAGLESYQQNVNFIAPTLTFLGIEEEKLLTITPNPVVGLIYENKKKEKRVMDIKEIPKFCDATIKRVLEKVKKFNFDVKHGYAEPDISKEDVEYMMFYEEYIQDRLRHRDQMRHWESYVNGRPLKQRREHP